jgi:FRG domain-containing protein
MLGPDQAKRVLDVLALRRLSDHLDEAVDPADYEGVLRELEPTLPLVHATPDLPLFSVLPTTFEDRDRWHELLAHYAFDDGVLDRLLEAGFVPLDRESAEFGVVGDPFPPTVPGRYLLLDSDYATVLLPPESGRRRNASLERLARARYRQHVPVLDFEESALLSVGAIRGQQAYHGSLSGNYFEPVDVTVSTRSELESVVDRVRENLADQPEIAAWFRGQVREYLTDDLGTEAEQGVCPWRSLRDPSLTPSLCRQLSGLRGSWREYASLLVELGEYGTFLDDELDIPAFDLRPPADRPDERLGAEWGAFAFSVQWDTGEVHDYQHAFRALQRMFFFQHYGLPSTVLDITKDLDVALFFAQHRLENGRYVPVGSESAGVLYVLLLHAGLDHFMDSREISEHYGLLRPLRQKCGLIAGASMISRNHYARFVSLRVHLEGDIEWAELTPEHLFPTTDEDDFLRQLLMFANERGLSRIRPFVVAE